ncbi:MAG: DUF368 domain-containing protein [Eubacteriales bacterium]|nr:DUF368 domain-containing protein [Eubacteriales bacterium]
MEKTRSAANAALLKKIIAGVLIGMGAILPGVSGGVMAVSMGLYEGMIQAVSNFFKKPKQNFLFLLPIGIGGVVGVLITTGVLEWSLTHYENQVIFLFMGFVVGSIPSIVSEANSKGGFKARYLWAGLAGVALLVLLWLGENTLAENVDAGITNLQAALAGGIMSAGTIIPGISTSFMLMYLGWYQPVVEALNQMNIPLLLCLGGGFVVVSLLIIKAVNWLFERFHGYAYYAVLGFTITSMVLICPKGSEGLLVNLAMMAAGVVISLLLSKGLSGHKESED